MVHDLRDFATDARRTVDDTPFGGGPGMVLTPGPLFAAIDGTAARQPAVQAALTKYEVTYQLPNPEEFRKRGNDTLSAICSAPNVDQAVALTSALLQINTDMEAKYGAMSEMLGGAVQAAVQKVEDKIRADIDQLGELVEPALQLEDDEEYDTVGGFVYHRIGRVPVVGDTVVVEPFTITVIKVSGRRVGKVRVRWTPSAVAAAQTSGDGA